MNYSRRIFAGGVVALLATSSLGFAQSFPSKQIRIVVPYPAGGSTDSIARLLAAELQGDLGQTVVVENRPGASGAIGTREVAKAEADGHTLVLGTNQTHATNSFLLKEPGYDPIKDFVAVAGIADLQHVLVVRKDIAAKSVGELVALLKAEPEKLNYGSSGVGSGAHLTAELFMTRSATKATHVPFRGAGPMALEIVAGRIDFAFATLPSVLGQIQAGEMRALAVASDIRAPQLPEVPMLKETGVTGSEGDSWIALFAPANTPAAAVERLSKAIAAIMAKPEIKANAIKQGNAVNVREAADFKSYHAREMAKWAEVIKAANVAKQD